MNKFVKLIFGDPNEKTLKQLSIDVEKVNAFEAEIEKLSDEQLKAKTQEFRDRLKKGDTLESIEHEAFAVVRESAKRTLKQRHFDVQLMGGFVLHRGSIAEMRTGEGKTLTSTLAIYLNGVVGRGVHVVTVNDYLAKRDAVWMGQIFSFLGLSIGVIQHEGGYLYDETFKADAEDDEARDTTGSYKVQMDFLRPADRKAAYDADITYGTNNQFGFDYLRDNMATDKNQLVQRDLVYAIVDEIDSILIDEARTPLIISAPAEESADLYKKFTGIVTDLKENEDYNIDEKMKVSTFTEDGLHKIEKRLGVENLYVAGGLQLIHHAEQALKAHAIFKRDREYVVQDGEVKIVDEFTGRIMEGRRYSEGLHQAIEAKEGVDIKRESRTMATITFQNYFRMYEKLSGMTGTASTEAEEFAQIYRLQVIEIPTNMPVARTDDTDKIFKSEKGKWMAVVDEVKRLHEKGQPVLIGTVSVEQNELIDELLKRAGVPHEMLNAKNHEREGEIVAQAGTRGAVTLATNMAGRGVDIKLGGNPSTPESEQEIKDLGGLYVLGTERHESRRIDNQLRGRSGRQGDPGESQFFVSLEDDLMRIFGGDRVRNMMETLKMDEKTPIQNKIISNSLEKAQTRVEGRHFDTRKHVLQYDDVLNKHRTAIYERRRAILTNEDYDAKSEILEMIEREVERVVLFHTGDKKEYVELPEEFRQSQENKEGDWDPQEIIEVLRTIVDLDSDFENRVKNQLKEISKDKEELARQRTVVIEDFIELVKSRLQEIEEQFKDQKQLKKIQRTILLRTMDNAWILHLDTMSYLRHSIGLQGYGQRDPLVEYKRESFGIYNEMLEGVERDVVYNVFKILKQTVAAQHVLAMAPSVLEKAKLQFSGAQKTSEDKKTARAAASIVKDSKDKIGRNEMCPCGSGLKYKKCCGK
ncbi:preprotein translocase subunit SecA [Patescibacteria group bacterium]|nr:preprotein translocase subunit SecA [Patescibacteria group bacterium]